MPVSGFRKLLIVSDINGFPETTIKPLLYRDTEILLLHLSQLSKRPDLHGTDLHNHLFNEGGMQQAIRAIRENNKAPCIGIGFSAGGTALWKAVKEGLELNALICVSSTRLRLETSSLTVPTLVLWGELDPYKATESWNNTIPALCKTYPGMHHEFYRSETVSSQSALWTDIAEFLRCVFPTANT